MNGIALVESMQDRASLDVLWMLPVGSSGSQVALCLSISYSTDRFKPQCEKEVYLHQ